MERRARDVIPLRTYRPFGISLYVAFRVRLGETRSRRHVAFQTPPARYGVSGVSRSAVEFYHGVYRRRDMDFTMVV